MSIFNNKLKLFMGLGAIFLLLVFLFAAWGRWKDHQLQVRLRHVEARLEQDRGRSVLVRSGMHPSFARFQSAGFLPGESQVDIRRFGHRWVSTPSDHSQSETVLEWRIPPIQAQEIRIVGEFNRWGQEDPGSGVQSRFTRVSEADGECWKLVLTKRDLESMLRQNVLTYRIQVEGRDRLDPVGEEFSEHAGPNGSWANLFRVEQGEINQKNGTQHENKTLGSTQYQPQWRVLELELSSLVPEKILATPHNVLSYLLESRAAEKIANWGFNAVLMLPLQLSDTGARSWRHRYLTMVPFTYDGLYGSADDFKKWIQSLQKLGVKVWIDFNVGHFHVRAARGAQSLAGESLYFWRNSNDLPFFTSQQSGWRTQLYRFDSQDVQDYLLDSMRSWLLRFGLDGLRLDSVDGIMDSFGGDTFLKRALSTLHLEFPRISILGENYKFQNSWTQKIDYQSHSKLPKEWPSAGIDFSFDEEIYNWSTKEFHRPLGDVSIKKIRDSVHGRNQHWTPMLARYFTNHDESSNSRGGITGSYPFEKMAGSPEDRVWFYSLFQALYSVVGPVSLENLQPRTGQGGSWDNHLRIEEANLSREPFRSAHELLSSWYRYQSQHLEWFSMESLVPAPVVHLDDQNKVIVIEKSLERGAKKGWVVVNFLSRSHSLYDFGVDTPGTGGAGGALNVGWSQGSHQGSGRNVGKLQSAELIQSRLRERSHTVRLRGLPPRSVSWILQ
jgi:1,4-alpha-glucan branching enzyme